MSDGLSKIAREMLEAAAKTRLGIIASAGERDPDKRRALMELERNGLAHDDGVTWWIRDAGRAAVGAPSYDEMRARELASPLVAGRAC
jgi:hypothetical protein